VCEFISIINICGSSKNAPIFEINIFSDRSWGIQVKKLPVVFESRGLGIAIFTQNKFTKKIIFYISGAIQRKITIKFTF